MGQRLSTAMVLHCAFWDKHVEVILPRAHMVDLDDGTRKPIVLKPSPCLQDDIALLIGQEFIPRRKRVCPKIQIVNRVVLPAE